VINNHQSHGGFPHGFGDGQKLPCAIRFELIPIPITPTGKIQNFELRKRAEEDNA
jgi:hypothetical protein